MKELFLPAIKKIEYIVQSNPGSISFAQGALRVGGVPKEARAYIRTILETDVADYYGPAAGIPSFRNALAENFSSVAPSISEKNILVSHGSIGGLMTLCCTYLTANDSVLIPTPAYPVYENVIKSSGAKPLLVPAYRFNEKDKKWNLSIDIIKKNIFPHTKMILISNPSNPLGVFLQKEEIEALLSLAKEHNVLLVIDEAYDSFLFEKDFISSMNYIASSPHLVRLGSFSKNGSMSGWRIGYVIAEESIIKPLIPVQDAMLCCPSMIGQMLAEFMIKNPHLMIEQQKKVLAARNLVVEFFENRKNIEFQKPAGGFYIFFKQNQMPNDMFVLDLLDKHGVGVVPGSDFSTQTRQWTRLCFAREIPVLIAGLTKIDMFLNSASSKKSSLFSTI